MVLHIFMTTIMPITLMVGAGFAMGRTFKIDLDTLSKMNFYLVSPAFLFVNTYRYTFAEGGSNLLLLTIAMFVMTWLVSIVIERLSGMEGAKTGILRNAILFNNCGNIGIPLITFIYSNAPYAAPDGATPLLGAAVAVQVVVFAFQNIVTNSFGFYFAGRGKLSAFDAVRLVIGMPIIYAVALGFGLNAAAVDITHTFLWPALQNISNALIMIALFTLGVQLSRTPFDFFRREVLTGAFGRLIGGPLVAACCLWIYTAVLGFSLPAVSSQVLFISAAVPSGVTTALIAAALHNHADFATQLVVATTLISSVTLPVIILLANMMYI